MADPQTTNIGLFQPTRGTDVGVWDTPMNSNASLLDLCIGGITTIPLNNSNVVLSAAQFQSKTIVFSSTLTGNVAITFPTSFSKSYEIQNTCTGSSAFLITLQTTAAGGAVIALPLNEFVDVINDTKNIGFKNLGRIGSYWDHAGLGVPAWVSGCTVPPYLNCDGTSFSSATYPALTNYLGGTTLPDMRGRVRGYLNQGTGRMTAGGGGVDGNTFGAAGGSEFMQLHSHAFAGTAQTWGLSQGNIPFNANNGVGLAGGGGGGVQANAVGAINTVPITPAGNIANTGTGGSQNMQPTAIGGITMIRAG